MKNCLLINQKSKFKNQNGQALLIVLLGMAVVLTLVLSIVSRSVTDVSITKKDEESLRAFSAAEAGVEQVLLSGTGASGSFAESNSRYVGTVTSFGNESIYALPGTYNSGEVATLWFVSHDSGGNFTCSGLPCVDAASTGFKICWKGSSTYPAIEVSLYYDLNRAALVENGANFSGVRIGRSTFDSSPTRTENNFARANGDCGLDENYNYETNINYLAFSTGFGLNSACNQPGCLLFARIKVFYAPTEFIVGLTGGDVFPSQGNKIESYGYSGDATRKVEAIQTYSAPLDIFENAVFTNTGSLSK